MNGGDEAELSLDTWTALLAGSAPWSTGEQRMESWNRLLAFGQVMAGCTTIMILWSAHDVAVKDSVRAATAGTIAICLLVVPPALRMTRLPAWSHSVAVNLVTRVSLVAVTGLAIYALLPGWAALWSTPMAVAMGLDGLVTCNELGWRPRTAVWYRKFLLSGFHLGMVGALVATLVSRGGDAGHIALPIYVCVHAWAAAAAATLWFVSLVQRGDLGERARSVEEVVEAERRQRAHWLHDDVCAQLRLVSLKLQTNAASKEEVVALLDDFDHQLRLRQLDELFGAGKVRIAEVLQPFIRHAQNQGVHIEGVPAFETAALTLPAHKARLAARVASVLTSNALNAGAMVVSYDVHLSDKLLHISVSDDGPGFSIADVPHGRGLWTLMEELKPGSLEIARRPQGGTTVTAAIPFAEGSVNGIDLARR